MKIIEYNKLNKKRRNSLLLRPSINMSETYNIVKPILDEIKDNGYKSAVKYARKFDGFRGKKLRVTEDELTNSDKEVTKNFKRAVKTAVKNIHLFHKKQIPKKYSLEIMSGIKCSREFRAIENVGLYIEEDTDYVIDAIDDIKGKVAIIKHCVQRNIGIISSMGTGNRISFKDFEITDISKTYGCPLARKLRKSLLLMLKKSERF